MTSDRIASATSGGQRLHWIDALRGVAAVLVMFSHYVWTPLGTAEGRWHYILSPGEFGVAAFFCVSGLVIPLSVRSLNGVRGSAAFIVNRIFRLYPIYWISIGVSFFAIPFALKYRLINFTMLQRFIGVPDIVPVFWTLQVELVFYAAIIAIVGLKVNRVRIFFILFIAAIVGSLACGLIRDLFIIKAPTALFTGLTLMFGVATLFENRRVRVMRESWIYTSFAAAVICLPTAWFLTYERNWGHGEVAGASAILEIINYSLGIGTFIVLAKFARAVPGWLNYLGVISYPLYVIHEPVFDFLNSLHKLNYWYVVFISAALSLMLAAVMHLVVEEPLIKVGRSLAKSIKAGGRASPSMVQTAANP